MFDNVHDGIPGTAMPAATEGGIGVGMSDEEIWQCYLYQKRGKEGQRGRDRKRHRGKELFYGSAACGTCHMINGKGGRLGPDLSSTGASRSVEY